MRRRAAAPSRRLRWLASIVAFGLACAAVGPGQPAWVSGEDPAYPRAVYLTGVGTGRDPDAAAASARAEISRIFRSQVESSVRDETKQTRVEAGRASHSQIVETLEIDTRVTSTGSFEGVVVARTWQERRTGTHYALAVLHRRKALAALDGEIAAADERVNGALGRVEAAATHLGRARELIAAARASASRDDLLARARVLGRPALVDGPGTAAIERDLERVLAETRFRVRALEVDSESGAVRAELPKLEEQLAETITGIGFALATPGDRSAANVWLTCRMSLQEIPRDFAGRFVRWEGAYELTGSPPDGPVILASEASGGESYATVELARTRALAKGAVELSKDLRGRISRYLNESTSD